MSAKRKPASMHAVGDGPLLPQHEKLIQESGISAEVARRRGYRSLAGDAGLVALRGYGFSGRAASAARLPGLLIPLYFNSTEPWGYQYRPDVPRRQPGPADGRPAKVVKYETPTGQSMRLDVPPGQLLDERGEVERLHNKAEPLWVTEGSRKVDAAITAGAVAVGLLGVTMWHTEDWEMLHVSGRDVFLAFDSDLTANKAVNDQLRKLSKFLRGRGAAVHICVIPPGPNGAKVGLDDYLADGGTLEALMREAQEQAPPPDISSPDGRPALDVSNESLLFQKLHADLGTGPLTGLYLRDGLLVRVPAVGEDGYITAREGEDDGPAQVRPVTAGVLKALLQLRCYTYRLSGERMDVVPWAPPQAACESVVQLAAEAPNLPRLRGVTHVPVMLRDGSILTEPGYHADSKLLYLPDPGLVVPPIPERVTRADRDSARDLLLELLADFPFASDSDRANYLGLLLTPLLRVVRPGPWPLFAINAPMSGSGKSLLAEVARIVHGGVFRPDLSDSDEEVRKSITSVLLTTTGPVVTFDNVSRTLRSVALTALLTTATWGDRNLGRNIELTLANDRLWMVTGNNVHLDGDLPRRTVWATIDPKQAHPERRTDIAVADLASHVRARRGEVLAALLTLVRYWAQKPPGRRPAPALRQDSYAAWASLVAGVLATSGVGGRFLDPSTDRAPISETDAEWEPVLARLDKEFQGEMFTAKSAAEVLISTPGGGDSLPAPLMEKLERGYAQFVQALGRYFLNRDGRFSGRYVARQAGVRDHSKLWRIERTPD